jgi:hypothetical protein
LRQRWLYLHIYHARCTEGNTHAALTVQGFVITLRLRLRKNDRHIIIPVKANHVSFTANSRGCRCLKECTDPSKAYVL